MNVFLIGRDEMAVLLHPVLKREVEVHIKNCETCSFCRTCRVRNCPSLDFIIETNLPPGDVDDLAVLSPG